MLMLLSPSKTLDISNINTRQFTMPYYVQQANYLAEQLSKQHVDQLSKLMSISMSLAKLNADRFQNFSKTSNLTNSKQALFTYKGDVYSMMDIANYSILELDFAQKHLCIISGLYGILRPLDLIQAYRLEMSINLATDQGQNLYEFWGNKITEFIQENYANDKIINLASQEYSKAIDSKSFSNRWINVSFKEKHQNSYRIIGILAKRARGMMANFIIKNQITDYIQLKDFNEANYQFNPQLSSSQEFVFTK